MARDWSKKELRAAIEVYLEMLEKQRRGKSFIKKAYYRQLSKKYNNRTESAFERRMQNISYIFSLQGRKWVQGLKPLSNVGNFRLVEIEKILSGLENRPADDNIELQNEILDALKSIPTKTNNIANKPGGNKKPIARISSATAYKRDVDVAKWILINAKGKCECCRKNAPFERGDGSPYLEVHHLRRLADKGSDTITNAIAVCPNCHRALHYGNERDFRLEELYVSIDRLVKE